MSKPNDNKPAIELEELSMDTVLDVVYGVLLALRTLGVLIELVLAGVL